MSEAQGVANPNAFDDRVDTQPQISNQEVLSLLVRCLLYLRSVKTLFFVKFGFAFIGFIPGLYAPWFGKVLLDQVIQQKSIEDQQVTFPFYFTPFVDAVKDMAPMEVMFFFTAIFLVLLFIFGRGGLYPKLEFGQDSATQSEGKLSAGGSGMSGLLGIIEAMVDIRLHQYLSNNFRTELFEKLTRMPMKTVDDHRIGDSVYRVMYDAPDLPDVCFTITFMPFFTLLGVMTSFYQMIVGYSEVAPAIIWIALAALPIALIATLPLSGFVRKIQQTSRASGSATTNAIEESMSNLHAVQSLGGMKHESERVASRSAESFRRFRHVVLTGIGVESIGSTISGILSIIVIVIVTNAIIEGSMSVGDFAVLLPLASGIAGSGIALGMFWIGLQSQVAAVRRVFFFIDLDSEEPDPSKSKLASITEGVKMADAGLTYANGHVALRNIDLELRLGELIAIVGPTGAGKTSLAYLIPGYYKATVGAVRIDGISVDTINLDSLRDQVTYVFQEHLLLNESIRENLLLASPNASEEDIVRACETSGANEFIEKLKDGLDTVLGQSGDTLSVGQKQRLCIARGLVRNTPVLILDEPTAALDPQAENALVGGLQKAAEDRLVIVIAHRLSTIRKADRIVFLEEGEVRDVGSHDELMADAESSYRRFVELQTDPD